MNKALVLYIIIFLFLCLNTTNSFSTNNCISQNTLSPNLNNITRDNAFNFQNTCVLITDSNNNIRFLLNEKFANRVISPGSIFKIFTAYTLLAEKDKYNFNPSKNHFCKGYFIPKLYDFTYYDIENYNLPQNNNYRSFRCSLKKGHGNTNLNNALLQSCNFYFLKVTEKNQYNINLNIDHFFSLKSIISPVSKNPNSSFESHISLIGEGPARRFSLLNLCSIFSTFFNNSPLRIYSKKSYSEKSTNLSINPVIRDQIISILHDVFTKGTLSKIKIKNKNIQLIAGKTGSPTRNGERYRTHGINIIFFKYKNSLYTMLTFTEKGSGSTSAAGVSEYILNNL